MEDNNYYAEGGGATEPDVREQSISSVMRKVIPDIHRFRIWFGISRKDAIEIVVQYIELFEKINKTTNRFVNNFHAVDTAYKVYIKEYPLFIFKKTAAENPPSRADKVNMVRHYPENAFDLHRPIFNEYFND